MNHQPIPLPLTFMSDTMQLVTGINIIWDVLRQTKMMYYLIRVMHLNYIEAM
jgi:hypothetical protein